MQSNTLLLIILAGILAYSMVYFQYFFRSKERNRLRYILGFLRFLALFSMFILVINPKFIKDSYVLEKTNLVILADNSSSIKNAGASEELSNALGYLLESSDLNDKFEVSSYIFGNEINIEDTLSFDDPLTNIGKALTTVNNIYGGENTALLVLTDGNQNIGEDYEFYAGLQQNSIYPIVIGDTTRYDDLSIDQVNTNKFAFLKNQFPIEIFISYSGNPDVTTELRIVENGKVVFKEKLTLSKKQNSIIKNVLLEASDVGIQNLNVQLTPLQNEKNITNNNRQVVLEVIDEKTEIAIVSEILHPDLGALKKSIETNEQRKVSLVNPSDDVSSLDSFDLLILYQPEESFTEIYELISNKGLNYFTITGSQTDWSFLNAIQNSYQMNSFDQNEEVFPILNEGFTKFDIKEFEVEDLPPLQTVLGELLITTSFENILEQKIKGIPLNEPLFAILETNENREAVLYGEDIWKWRMQVFKEDKSFKRFDDLMAKVILYLTDSNPRTRLNLDYQTVYEGSGKAYIKATYFDETYIFDPKASLKVRVTNSETKDSNELPMLLKNGNYQTDLSSLLPGNYNFEVLVETKGIAEKGKFSILDYDLEKQFLSSNYKKLDRAAITSGGQLFYPDQLPEIISDLIQDNRYLPIQKSNENIVSLIDFKLLLAVMAFALAMEWFLRKYYGLI